MLRATAVVAALIGVLLIAPAARAQMDSREAIALQHELQDLRRDLQNLSDRVGRGGGSPSGGRSEPSSGGEITGQLLSRVEALEDQVRRLRGRIDEVANQQQRQGDDLNKKIGDLNFQLQSMQPGGGGASPAAAPQRAPVPVAPPPAAAAAPAAVTPTPRRTPELALQEGNADLARRDYTAAEAAAREVLNNNKTSPRAYDAQWLLAQSLAGRKEFSQSAIAFDDAYKRNRKGARAPDALLGLANSLTGIGERRAACDTLAQLRSEFPQPRPDLRDQITVASQRAACR